MEDEERAGGTGVLQGGASRGLWLLWGSWLGCLLGYVGQIIWWHIAVYIVLFWGTGLTLMVFLKHSRKAQALQGTVKPESAAVPAGADGKDEGQKGAPAAPDLSPETTISAGTTVVGTCQIRGRLRVMGRIEGEVSAPDGRVYIMPNGVVLGRIEAQEVSIDGRVEGEVKTSTLSILSHGYMQGDITMASLTIAAGGVFSGVSHRTEPPEVPVKRPVPPLSAVPLVSPAVVMTPPVAGERTGGAAVGKAEKDPDRKEKKGSGQHTEGT